MASAAEADEGVARKKRVADRQITKDDNLAEGDSDGGSGEGGTWKKAPDDVMASRKIVKARRPGQAAAGAPAAAANPFANVKLVVPLPPPTVAAGGGVEKKPGAAAAGDQVNVVAAAAAVKAAGEVAAAADMRDGKGSNEMSTALQTEGKDGVEKTKGVKEVVEENGNQRHGNANGLEAGEKKNEGKTSANEGKAGAGRGEDTTKEGREEADDDDEKEEEGESGESRRKDVQEVAGSAASAQPQAPPLSSSSSLLFASSFGASSPFAGASAGSSPAFAGFSFASSSAFGVAGQSFPPLSSIFGGKRDEQLPPPASSTPFSFFGPSSSAITTSGAPSSSSGGVGVGTGLLSSAGGAAGGGGAIVNLSEQHVETGEEEETNVFSGAAVLFEYMDGKSWKERGRGDLRLNVPKNESHRPRLVMRSKGNLRLLMNASIFPDMKVTKMDGRGVTFVCVNTAAASGGAGAAKVGGLATYAVRLADASLASSFLAMMEENKLRAGNCPSLAPSGKRPLEQTAEGAGGGEEKEQSGSKRAATEEKSCGGGGRVDVADDTTKIAAASAGTRSSDDDQKTREQEQEQEEQQKEREKVTTDRADEDGGKGEEAV